MRVEQDAMMLVRADLCERLDLLRALALRTSARDFNESVESLRRLAAAYGMAPVVALAEALERAVAEGGRRGHRDCPTALYLSRLQDAIGCERLDSAAGEAMLASVSVRLC
ncbi:MAG: hypothetical protein JOZ90_12660 [Alphaproteobacteria bacterium]|nr:hypothetical protein [Alphaproteobacteria bacterium]MBV9371788.1 hypothetical protein [Alphaproteobacteria bacterium]MBV9901927.1 hypothetical protein [Alphaproteobacteria bacterium]